VRHVLSRRRRVDEAKRSLASYSRAIRGEASSRIRGSRNRPAGQAAAYRFLRLKGKPCTRDEDNENYTNAGNRRQLYTIIESRGIDLCWSTANRLRVGLLFSLFSLCREITRYYYYFSPKLAFSNFRWTLFSEGGTGSPMRVQQGNGIFFFSPLAPASALLPLKSVCDCHRNRSLRHRLRHRANSGQRGDTDQNEIAMPTHKIVPR